MYHQNTLIIFSPQYVDMFALGHRPRGSPCTPLGAEQTRRRRTPFLLPQRQQVPPPHDDRIHMNDRSSCKEGRLGTTSRAGICIGATLEYLLRGMPFEVMKVKGRWASNAFLVYQTKHEVHKNFIRLTMPQIRR
jgi:hypothetical protein